MSQRHLNDDQLQDYLDGYIVPGEPLADHLLHCPRCQRALSVYESLYSALKQEPESKLSPGFADAVMNRLPEHVPVVEPAPESRFYLKDSLIMFFAAAVVIAASIYFITPDLFTKAFAGLSVPTSMPDNRIMDDAGSFLSQLNISTLSIIFVVLTFVGIGVVDKIITRRRDHQKPVSFLV